MNEQPTSSGTGIVEPRDCVEELLKFILESHIKGTLEIDLGLPTDFCSNLLLDHLKLDSTDCIHGDTPYPLYRHLALSLYESIICGGFCGTCNKSAFFNEDNDLMEKREWDELVVHQRSELLNILKAVDFELHVQEPFFTQLKDGLKTIEGRCAVGHYNRIGSGALVLFNKCVVFEVKEVNWYASFFNMLEAESLEKVLPGVKTIEEGVQVYRTFYSEGKEKSNGVLAISITKSNAQPYIPLAKLLSGLSYRRIQSLLGHTCTARTSNSLPQFNSDLSMSVFTCDPNVR